MIPTIKKNGYEWKLRLVEPKIKEGKVYSDLRINEEQRKRYNNIKNIKHKLKAPSLSPERREQLQVELSKLKNLKQNE